MSTFSKSEMKCAVEHRTMPHVTLCNVFLCFNDIGHQSARLLSSSPWSLFSSSKGSLCKALKHWSVLVCYDDLTCICEATEEEGKLKPHILVSSKRKQTMLERMTQVYIGKYNIHKERLMTIVGQLDEDEDYRLVANNCQHWAKKLLKGLGIDLDSPSFMKQLNFIDHSLYKLMGLESI